jgi:glycosyltransferase involved in cell wall biosynthesis
LPGPDAGNSRYSNWYHLEKRPYPLDFLGRCRMAVKGVPYPIQEYRRSALRRLFELIEANDYRFILVRYCHSASGLFNLPEKFRRRSILDFDDLLSGSVYASLFKTEGGPHRKLLRALNKALLTRYEAKCMGFGAALFCSDLDRRKMDPAQRGHAFVVPNIYENQSFVEHRFGDGHAAPNNLLFVGTLNYEPNIGGLRWFIQTVFKRFKAEFHDAKLIVVGRAPNDHVKALCAAEEAVELHPDVVDVRGYYERCRAVVVPLLIGGGTRIKILEAALAGRPVLSTPAGAEGLDLIDGSDLLLFEGPEDFCAKYRQLGDRNVYQDIAARACRVVQDKYSWVKFEESMQRVLAHIEEVI